MKKLECQKTDIIECGAGEKTLESPLDCKEIEPVHPKGNQSWIFIGRTDAEAETPRLWPRDMESWLIGKDPDAGRVWGQEEKGTTEDETAGWCHWLDGRESEWTAGVGDGQGGLACCNSWGRKESDTTKGLNWPRNDDPGLWNPFFFIAVNTPSLTFTILTIFKCTVYWHLGHSHCWATLTSICLPNILHLQTLELFPHYTRPLLSPLSPGPDSQHSTFCLWI